MPKKMSGQREQAPEEGKRYQQTAEKQGVRPSAHWRLLSDMVEISAAPIKDIITRGNWPFLCGQAVKLHPASSASLSCIVNFTHAASGSLNVAFELSFSDGSIWIARVPRSRCDDLVSEVTTMRLVAKRTSIPVPEVYGFDADDDNPFGFPYMLMNALPGRPLRIPFVGSVPREFHPKIASQMAGYVKQLSEITFSEIGRIQPDSTDGGQGIRVGSMSFKKNRAGPFNSSTAYFRCLEQQKVGLIHSRHMGEDDWPEFRRYCQVYTDMIPFIVYPDLRRGPFPLRHGDLHYKNILVDDDFNITAVLDWESAMITPWESFAIYGDFMYTGATYHPGLIRLNKLFVEAIRKLEDGRGLGNRGTTSLSDIIDSPLPLLLMESSGVPRTGEAADRYVHVLLHGLLGNGTTFENYKARMKALKGRPWWRQG